MNRRHRLRGRAAFAAVRARRATGASNGLRVAVAHNRMEPARIGYSVPRSTGGAVVRNRVRRRLREALRPRLPELTGLDLVVSVSAEAARAPWPVLVAGVDRGIEAARRRLAGRGR